MAELDRWLGERVELLQGKVASLLGDAASCTSKVIQSPVTHQSAIANELYDAYRRENGHFRNLTN
ncbi:hypothetical protein LOZ80_07375 [Paenibacillus sp. HWE-109]|uniref:hypothetical protein n=1 Tax=Paenibacillus sp. HWE-109 TaxID=1306526 RepID=UPI001EE093C9|nr:hypothetical protein [Paenibacillus sp. HWE-109]UKS28736.1 hypothetical protein LOZ80_07375 [Paenibacillus sp. HWE-109]